MHGDHHPLVPYDVTSHANIPVEVSSFEFSANGQIVRTDTVEEAKYGQTLAYVTRRWEPASPGTYLLQVRAADVGGTFVPMAEVQVTVGEVTPTPAEEAEPTAKPTIAPLALFASVGSARFGVGVGGLSPTSIRMGKLQAVSRKAAATSRAGMRPRGVSMGRASFGELPASLELAGN